MDQAARRFARWILLLHVALLVLLLVIVAISVRTLYGGARTQAIEQAKQTQELLARQTALGLQHYYDSITGVVELLQPVEGESTRGREAERRKVLDQSIFVRMAPSIWKSLSGKVSSLFVVDTQDSMRIVYVLGAATDAPDPAQVVLKLAPWIEGVDRASISPFLTLNTAADSRAGAHLVCVPMRGLEGMIMVAVVPIAMIEQTLLRDVNSRPTTGAMLVDEQGVIVSSPRAQIVGLNVRTDIQDPRTRQIAERYLGIGGAGTELFEEPERIGDELMEPAMTSIQPADILGRLWSVVINSSLSDIENVVKPIFHDALIWAAFVIGATTLILVSTAIQMIRGRNRLERLRGEIIARELTQAREIQLAWLPDNDDDPPHIDLSAVNHPATQISGDFYNWFQLCDGRTAVVIGDVTGHGMAAAFLMATTQLLVRTTMPRFSEPGECLQEVNRQLCQNPFNGQFVTMQILVIDVNEGEVSAATAGHPPPLVGEGADFRPLNITPQLVLGVDGSVSYSTEKFRLARGSSLVLYTDGVIDALNLKGERFTVDGLSAALYGRYEHAQAIVDTIITAINRFRGDHHLPDDLTLVAVQLQEAATPRSRAVAEVGSV